MYLYGKFGEDAIQIAPARAMMIPIVILRIPFKFKIFRARVPMSELSELCRPIYPHGTFGGDPPLASAGIASTAPTATRVKFKEILLNLNCFVPECLCQNLASSAGLSTRTALLVEIRHSVRPALRPQRGRRCDKN